MIEHSEFFIDERGIFTVESRSYPDAIWHEYAVEFGQADTEERFEAFCQRLIEKGEDERSAKLRALLGARGFC